MRGPEDAVMWVALKRESGINVEPLKEELRGKLAQALPDVQFSFEPADIINEVMSFGSSTPVEVAVSGPNFSQTRPYAAKIKAELGEDCRAARPASRPVARLSHDPRGRGSQEGGHGVRHAGRCGPVAWPRPLPPAASPCRTSGPIRKTGIGYQVQVEVPRPVVRTPRGIKPLGSIADLQMVPVKRNAAGAGPGPRRGHGFHAEPCPAKSTATTCDAR